jgi:hypothetical protein
MTPPAWQTSFGGKKSVLSLSIYRRAIARHHLERGLLLKPELLVALNAKKLKQIL